MNVWDILIIVVVAALAGRAVWKIVSDRRRGKLCPGCDCGCGGTAPKKQCKKDTDCSEP